MAEHTPGMTLRDHLAARAMQAALTNWPADAGDWMRERAELAQRAYAMADAMLEARNALRAELERACGRGNV